VDDRDRPRHLEKPELKSNTYVASVLTPTSKSVPAGHYGSTLREQRAHMARKPRIDLTGVAQHVIQRGNDRQPCFFRDVDRQRYLQDLLEPIVAHRCQVHAYVLMKNHVQVTSRAQR
jgi:hypothetical protein